MKNLLLPLLACLMPFILRSDPCPNDTIPPLIESRGSTWDCSYNIFEDSDTNFITVTENSECGLRVVEIADWDMVKGSCDDDFVKQYTVVWYAEDEAGNISNFEQEITILRPALEDIEFPADTMIQCPAAGFEDHELFGYPSINGNNLTDMCGFRVKYSILDTVPGWLTGQCLPQVQKEWTVIENCTGLTRVDTQTISIIDTIRPIIACTALEDTVSLAIDPLTCVVMYNFPQTGAIDFCAPDSQLVFDYFIDGEATGSETMLMAGTYEASVVVRDPCDNADTCNYFIRVLDDSPPVMECPVPPDTVVLTEINQAVDVAELGVLAEDCAGEVDLVYRFSGQGPESDSSTQIFTCDMANTTVNITVTASDTSGNQTSIGCGVYVTTEGNPCNLVRSNPTAFRTGDRIHVQPRAYYDGQRLVLQSQGGISKAMLYNISGQVVWSKSWPESIQKYQTHLSQNFQSGIYILKIGNEAGEYENVKVAIF